LGNAEELRAGYSWGEKKKEEKKEASTFPKEKDARGRKK